MVPGMTERAARAAELRRAELIAESRRGCISTEGASVRPLARRRRRRGRTEALVRAIGHRLMLVRTATSTVIER